MASAPTKLVVRQWGGARGHLMSRDVVSIAYVNVGTLNQDVYEHDFSGTGVEMWALSNGGLFIRHPSARLWSDYIVSDNT